jgi:hypothetical protein
MSSLLKALPPISEAAQAVIVTAIVNRVHLGVERAAFVLEIKDKSSGEELQYMRKLTLMMNLNCNKDSKDAIELLKMLSKTMII